MLFVLRRSILWNMWTSGNDYVRRKITVWLDIVGKRKMKFTFRALSVLFGLWDGVLYFPRRTFSKLISNHWSIFSLFFNVIQIEKLMSARICNLHKYLCNSRFFHWPITITEHIQLLTSIWQCTVFTLKYR